MADETPTPADDAPEDVVPAAEEPTAEEPVADEAPREKPAIPGADLEVDLVMEGDGRREDPYAYGDDEDGPGGSPDEVEVVDEPETPRVKPAIPGADLEVDIVLEGADPLATAEEVAAAEAEAEQDRADEMPVAAVIDLAAGARYRATGKRKTAVARVILRPGTGAYTINGKPLDAFFPRPTLQRQIRQPLEAVGYEDRMDVVARMHGGGVSAQAGALRHGISRALLEADPNLRGELKRRGFLTRDSRAKERKKAGLKKARKRPQFSKR